MDAVPDKILKKKLRKREEKRKAKKLKQKAEQEKKEEDDEQVKEQEIIENISPQQDLKFAHLTKEKPRKRKQEGEDHAEVDEEDESKGGKKMKKMAKTDEQQLPGTSVGMSNILSDKSFSSLESHVSEATMKGIVEMGFTHMTDIQASECYQQGFFNCHYF